ncbi:MAG: acyltransferase family protein [Lachnospiraceae bacterium]|nr:acyltransferase family protein [Lachnospiraceae bacterium]
MVERVSKSKTKRNMIHLEVLRMIAIFLVLFNHTGQDGFMYFVVAQKSIFYPVYLFISILDKVAVPLFFMISGALLLNKEEQIRTIYKKRISRILIVLISISFIIYIVEECSFHFSQMDIKTFLLLIYQKPIHTRLWYLYSYLGILVMLPLLRKMAKAMTIDEYRYFMLCHVAIFGLIPVFEYLLSCGQVCITSRFDPDLVTSYSIFYFLVGYYFENLLDKDLYNIKTVIVANFWGIGAILLSCYVTHYYIQVTGDGNPQKFHNCLIAIPTIAVYITIKYIFLKISLKDRIQQLIQVVGSTTFGIYLLENWYRGWTRWIYEFLLPYIGSFLACFFWILAACVVGGFATAVLKKIPVIGQII